MTGSQHSRFEGAPRDPSDPPSLTHDKETSPSTEGSMAPSFDLLQGRRMGSATKYKGKTVGPASVTEELEPLTFYLDYFRSNISCHHYGWKIDVTDFLHNEFIDIAKTYRPLLYAISAFSAYHFTISNPNGKLQDFLELYQSSVKLLRKSLATDKEHSVATLFTILQLATFEVCGI
jgi:hypothetical protein